MELIFQRVLRGLSTVDHAHISCDIRRPYGWILVYIDLRRMNMKIEEFGTENDKTIVMLHGANFVHSFGRQYQLAKTYHIIIPHIMGFGAEAHRVFDTEICVKELASYIETLGKKVTLIGFSLGAQLAFKLVSEYEYLFDSAILVSPWLIKEEKMLSEILDANLKQLHSLKNKWLCHIVGMMNGMLSLKVRREFVEQMQNVKYEISYITILHWIVFPILKI